MAYSHLLALSLLASSLTPVLATPLAYAQEAQDSRVFLEADTLTEDQNNNRMVAEGDVIAEFEGRRLTADKVIYDLGNQTVRAIGNVKIVDPDGTIRYAEEIEVDDTLGDGVATRFSAQLPQDAVVVAQAAKRQANGSNVLERTIYTACELCEENGYKPTWSLRARKAVQNTETQMISYQDVVIEVKGVPVLYFPYFAHPDPSSKRRSGLLFPTPGVSKDLGAYYYQPYFWAISPSQDLVIEPRIHTNVNPTIGGEYKQRFYSGLLEAKFSAAYDFEFNSDGDPLLFDSRGTVIQDPSTTTETLTESEREFRGHIFAKGQFDISDTWKWGFGLEEVSNDLYLRNYNIERVRDRYGPYSVESQRLISQLYTKRQDDSSYLDIALMSFIGLNEDDDNDTFAKVLPAIYADKFFDFGEFGLASANFSTAIIDRDDGDNVNRFSTGLSWENLYVAPAGLVFEPAAELRADHYDFELAATSSPPESQDEKTRTTGLASATLRWPLINRTSFGSVVIEPVVMAAFSESSLENGEVPNQDSTLFEYNVTSLFDANPYSQYDLIETGSRIAAGVRAQAQFQNGIEADLEFGRRWKDEDDLTVPFASNLRESESDYVIGAALNLNGRLRARSNIRLNDEFEISRVEATGSASISRLTFETQYFRIAEEAAFAADQDVEGIVIGATLDVTDNLRVMYGLNRNITENFDVTTLYGAELYDECSFIRLTVEERGVNDRGVGGGTNVRLAIGLKTLGQIDDGSFDNR